jgi:beta-glucosidase
MRSNRSRTLIAALVCMVVSIGAAGGAQAHGAQAHGAHPGRLASPPTATDAPYTSTVRYLLRQLTIDEKLLLVHGSIGEGIITPDTPTDPGANGSIGVVQGIPRLGIPVFRHTDSNGVNVFADSTAYPGRLGLAATFDRAGISRYARAVGQEGRALGIDLIYAPQLDLTRLPSWGRNLTTYGEDPYLAAQLGVRDVNAIQSTGLLAQIKHFAFYNGQDQDTPSIIDERAAHELYLKPYEATLRGATPSSAMCSYAKYQVSGVQSAPAYACVNTFGLQDLLRQQYGFKGWVGSDYGGSHATSDLTLGLDQEFLSNNFAPAALRPLVDPTSPSYDPAYAQALDGAVARILYQYQRFGRLDDSGYPAYAKTHVKKAPTPGASDERAGIALARNLAEETAVLLKNESQALPMRRTGHSSVAVIGPTAALMPAAPTNERSRGVGRRNLISPLRALKDGAGPAHVTYAPGIDRLGSVVPTAALTTSPGGSPGLTRITKDPSGTVVGTQVDPQLAGDQTDLVKGNSYTWTGTVNVPADDTYTLWLQRPAGTVVGHADGPNAGVNPGYRAGPFTGVFDTVGLSVDGTSRSLSPVSTILANTYPGGPTLNGQYLGLNTVGSAVPLSAGPHQITLSYAPNAKAATAPTFRLTWAAQQKDLADAVKAASRADTAVVFVDDADTVTAAGDVSTLGPGQDELIEKVAAANPNTVVVLNTNAAVQMPWLASVKSVVEMWYPGQEGGTATANLLYGKANPSGKLPITFPVDNQTPFAGHPERARPTDGSIVWSEGLEMGYRWYLANSVPAQYPFGFGKSYTRFSYSKLHLTKAGSRGEIRVSFQVRNVGGVSGTEVPQLYLALPPGSGEPSKRLANFDRISLRPGQATTVRLALDPSSADRPLSLWDTSTHDWRTPSGRFTVSVGSSVTDTPLIGSFKLG